MMAVAPLLVCLTAAALLIFLRDSSLKLQSGVGLVAAIVHLVFSVFLLQEVREVGTLALQLGEWAAPFGITFAIDRLSAMMLVITGFVHVMGSVYAISEINEDSAKAGFFPLLQTLVMGVSGAFSTGDLFNLYVWYEVMILSSFALLVIGKDSLQLEGTFKYAVLNFLSSTFFLIGLGLLYGATGTLNMADLALKLSSGEHGAAVGGASLLMMVGFAIKSGVFPFYSWLPTAYHLPSVTASAVFAGLLTKVGVYSLFRTFGMVLQSSKEQLMPLFLVISVLTMLLGVFGAATKFHSRKILGFHIISQIGYMTLGLAFFTVNAMGAAIFYLIHHILVKTNLFFISGAIRSATGSEDLGKTGGLLKALPVLAGVFVVSGFSLGGIPPLSGFFAKFAILKSGLEIDQFIAVFVGLFVGLLTLYSMTKIWAEAFWKENPSGAQVHPVPITTWIVVITMALGTLSLSLSPEWLLKLSMEAAQDLLSPNQYIEAVLKRGGS